MYNSSTNDKVVYKVGSNIRLIFQFPWQPSTPLSIYNELHIQRVMLHDRCLRLFLPTPSYPVYKFNGPLRL